MADSKHRFSYGHPLDNLKYNKYQLLLHPDEWTPIGHPEGKNFTSLIKEQYDSIDKFKAEFKEKALGHFGSGWAWLMNHNGQLQIATTPNQDNPLMDIVKIPGDIIIALDLWEHSYYLDYLLDALFLHKGKMERP